ncbi:MAG: ferritin family protein [Magnetococcales bacterium]|nr:ferritin family protein [Magnetococcales bacterium]
METAADFFKTAIYNEVKGAAFYNMAAEETENDESRMLFLKLADMEDGHTLELIRKAKNAPCGQGFDPEAYLKELESSMSSTISREEAAAIKKSDMPAVLQMAIALERNARDNYLNLANAATNPEVRQHCQVLAHEEEGHAKALENLLHSLEMTPDDRPGL